MAYEKVGTADVTGVSIFLKTISTFSHVELLDRREAWKGSALHAVVKEEDWVNSVRAVNHGLRNSREGFAHALESLAMQPDTALTRMLWDIPGVPKSAIILLLSPIDEIHEPVTSLIQQAFTDADDRLECLRVLLQRYPDQAMDGLRSFLRNFIQTAQKTPDSCSLAKWLVRCFTDVIEVLCNPSSSEPLLHDETFLTNHAGDMSMSKRVGDLWQLMTESLAVIFDRTKDWAPLYENDVMVDWMRDALIFGRNMTEHIRVFEAAFLGQSGSRFSGDDVESPAKITHVGKRMVEKLEKVLKHLVSWLRLTE
jgi:senataxin